MKKYIVEHIKLADIPVGEIFKIGKYEFIVLEHSRGTTTVILKDLLFESKKFGKDNNYKASYVDDLCGDFTNEISEIIGKGNLIGHIVDLTSDDGLKDYGKIKRCMSLLTTDLYRQYVEIIDKYKVKNWWWLATALSTPKHDPDNCVKCVSPSGCIYNDSYCNNNGVRPFCILNSNIFVSKRSVKIMDNTLKVNIEKSNKAVKLSDISVGQTFKIGDVTYIKFADEYGVTTAITKDIIFESDFGDDNKFEKSRVFEKLNNEFLPKVAEIIGYENICNVITDLTTLDGLTPYETMISKISLPTLNFYRENVEIFDKYKIDECWWLATPESAKPHNKPKWIVRVLPSGCIDNSFYNFNHGVRPLLNFVSSISVSCED